MPPIRTRSNRFTTRLDSEAPDEAYATDTSPPQPIPPTPFMRDGQRELSPENTFQDITSGDSYIIDGASYTYVVPSPSSSHIRPRETINHRVPHALGSYGHHVPPYQVKSSLPASPTTPAPFTPLPRMSQYMRAAQKVPWDIRFPHPQSEHDNFPALDDNGVLSFAIHSPVLQEDFILERNSTDPELTVADIYDSLYSMLCAGLSHTHLMYVSRTAGEKAQIEEAARRRIIDTSVMITPWRGKVRDILGNRYVVYQFVEDYDLGKWRIDFMEGGFN